MKRLMIVALFVPLLGCGAVFEVEKLRVGMGLIRRAPSEKTEDQTLIAERLLCAGVGVEAVESVLRSNGLNADEAHKVALLAVAQAKCGTQLPR